MTCRKFAIGSGHTDPGIDQVNVLVLNPGSATLKFGLYGVAGSSTDSTKTDASVLASGVIESTTPVDAVEQIIRSLRVPGGGGREPKVIDAVGCRVVHGGRFLVEPTRVTGAVLEQLRALKELASLHIPMDVAVLERVQQTLPTTPLVAVFDTAFHQTLPDVASTYALPTELCSRFGLRRYGFHGISHANVSARLMEQLGRGAGGTRIITCHLGSGASVCAVRDGHSVDISMGFTPMEGLAMGTRSGDVDPGLVLFLLRSVGMTADEVDDLLNRQSGLLGLSGLSADLRELERAARADDARAELALEVFAYRTAKYIGAFAVVLEGVDALAFTGGIGEHSASMRQRICRRLECLGLRLDDEQNRAPNGRAVRISEASSAAAIWVMVAEEEREIAALTYQHLAHPLGSG